MQIIELEGTPGERGFQQGRLLIEAHRALIRDFFSSDMWREVRPAPVPGWLLLRLLGLFGWRYTRPAVQRRLPDMAERVRGLGVGLGVDPAVAWGIQFMEIVMCEAGKSLAVPGGCTQVHARPHATRDKQPLMGRNYDFPNLLRPYQIVRRERPRHPQRLESLSVTQVPMAGAHHGINEAGLAVAANNARIWKGRNLRLNGAPYSHILTEILETCRTADQGRDKLASFKPRGNAGFFGLMDAAGRSYLVEFTASRVRVREPGPHGTLAQTNHFHMLDDANLPPGTYWTVKGMEGLPYEDSTVARYETAERLMREAAGQIDIETIKRVLRDHSANDGVGHDRTVCAHGVTGGTLSSIIVDIAQRRLLVADGAPCTSDYEPIEL